MLQTGLKIKRKVELLFAIDIHWNRKDGHDETPRRSKNRLPLALAKEIEFEADGVHSSSVHNLMPA
jgi:hypothetical protein